jgi:aspartate aminotransferase-like enzyme/GNAT superfamily N-acetyltransferase
MRGGWIVKQADTSSEFDQIHRLNYQTFAEELGQYVPDGSGRLVDRFHDRNTYFIALRDGRVVGMLAAQDRPPFSIESRLSDVSVLDALGGPLLEVRLLAIDPGFRNRLILPELLLALYRHACERAYTHLIVSGIATRIEMYGRMGFRALGPAVESGAASFVPMAMELTRPPAWAAPLIARSCGSAQEPHISLMPGPVAIAPPVRKAFQRQPVSHRSSEFFVAWERVRGALARLSGSMHVAIVAGSGTTANDAVALHLRAAFRDAPGLVLANGEFGERIARQAESAGLTFESLSWTWGQPWSIEHIEAALDRRPAWIWAVHLETSTGMLNRLPDLLSRAAARGIPVAADCVSSLGAVPLPQPLWMASGVSGKSLGSYGGLAFVFASPDALDRVEGRRFPATLDVRAGALCAGPQFTVPSPLLFALHSALAIRSDDSFARHWDKGCAVRRGLRGLGIPPLADEPDAAPCVTTFAVPDPAFLSRCRVLGFEPGVGAAYLTSRGWAQIATMGEVQLEDIARLFRGLAA